MKLIHLADIHLRKGGAKFKVYQEVIDNLFRKIDLVQDKKIFVICGDIIHDRNTLDAFVVQLFSQLMRGLEARGPVVIIQGNHDHHPSHADESAPYDILGALVSALDLEGISYMDKTGGVLIDGVFFGTVTIHDASETGDVRANAVKLDLPTFPTPAPEAEHRVALWHGGISSCRYGNLSVRSKGVSLQWFEGYDLALLGDIHLQQIGNHVVETAADGASNLKFSDTGVTWGYPGSLVQQDHGEQLWGHGFLVWDLAAKTIEAHHVACPEGYVTLRGSDLFYDQRWIGLHKHLEDPDFPKALRIRSVGGEAESTKTAMELLNARGVQVLSMSGLSTVKLPSRVAAAVESGYVHEGGCGALLEKRGLSVEEVVATSMLPKFSNDVLDRLREDRYAKLEKLLTRFRDVKGVNDTVLTLGLLKWSWILSFHDDNETRAFSDAGLTILHAPNGTGKTALLETMYLALYGDGFPSRTTKDDSASFINDEKPPSELAYTELAFGIGDSEYSILRKWNRQGDKAVVKEVALRKVTADGKEVVLHKGRVEVDKWVARNVCNGTDFLAGIMMTQGNDSDFLTMSSRDQCAMINRAFGLDALDALYDYLHETKNSMNYLLNQVPDSISEGGSEDIPALKASLAAAVNEEADLLQELESLPAVTKKTSPTKATYDAALLLLSDETPSADELRVSLSKAGTKLETITRIPLPAVRTDDSVGEFKGSFGEAKVVVDAQVRLEATVRKSGWKLEELTSTKALDVRGMANGPTATDIHAELVAAKRTGMTLRAKHKASAVKLKDLDKQIVADKATLEQALHLEKTTVSRVLSRKGTEIMALWDGAPGAARAALMLDYLVATAPDLLPSSATLLEEGFSPRPDFWEQDFDACVVALDMKVPSTVPSTVARNVPPSSDVLTKLYAREQQRLELAGQVDGDATRIAELDALISDLDEKTRTHEQRASEAAACRKRMEALAVMESCVEEIAGRGAAAKQKFEKEGSRLRTRMEDLAALLAAKETVAAYVTESTRVRLKERLATLDLLEKSKQVGVAEAQEAWNADVPVIAEYRRRLGHVLQALAMLKDIKDNVYGEYVLPELCKRVNRTIASVDSSIGVHATMENNTIRWYCVVSGSRFRIKRASGFQQFIIAMGVRVELGSMIRPCRTILIDEGFTACDGDHILKIPVFLDSLIAAGKFATILIVTHIEALQNGVSNTVSMRKGERMCL